MRPLRRQEQGMNESDGYHLDLAGAALIARASGALCWPAQRVLVVADLHLGKADRLARNGGGLLPPYDNAATLARLEAEVAATDPALVLCLGDSFDDAAGAATPDAATAAVLARLGAGRGWVWVTGNHDPGPGCPAIAHAETVADWRLGQLVFRHIATEHPPEPGEGEVSGHYHPKARLALRGATVARPCFLIDGGSGGGRAILPAFGAYTGGLAWTAPAFAALLSPGARAVLTGPRAVAVPVPVPAAGPAPSPVG